MEILTATNIAELFRHVRSWLANLNRASKTRQLHSLIALRDVILASRETAVYIRQIKETGTHNHSIEAHLAVLWTKLGFALQDIGISKLAKRCQINGQVWANPNAYDDEFIKKADVSLERMEKLANEILVQINT